LTTIAFGQDAVAAAHVQEDRRSGGLFRLRR
jgi:hypothetical protein